MLENLQKVKVNPFLAFLDEQAEAIGMTPEDLCEQIGYSPKVVEALEDQAWFRPSEETLVLLAHALGISLEEIREKTLKLWSEVETHSPDRGRDELTNLYQLVASGGKHDLLETARRRVENFLRSQESRDGREDVLDEQTGLAVLETFYANLGPRDKTELVHLIQRADAHYQALKARDDNRRLGFTIAKLSDVL
jgi:transcriptional regulator with XRE-family HTH domain